MEVLLKKIKIKKIKKNIVFRLDLNFEVRVRANQELIRPSKN
jgi:hypothetical protein